MNWKPIDTAPKDGRWILIRGRNSIGRLMVPVVASWRQGHDHLYGWHDSASLKNLNDLAATEAADWMPLPEIDVEGE